METKHRELFRALCSIVHVSQVDFLDKNHLVRNSELTCIDTLRRSIHKSRHTQLMVTKLIADQINVLRTEAVMTVMLAQCPQFWKESHTTIPTYMPGLLYFS